MQSSCCAVLALLLAVTCVRLQCSHCKVFLEESTSVNITEGDTAAFRCRVNDSVKVSSWIVNETLLNQLTIPDITTNSSVPQDGGPRIKILTIVGQSAYNTTSVQCSAFFDTGERRNSSVSELLIQGPLASVTALTNTSSESAISLTWDAPYSLDLSYFQVDILYCVEVCTLMGGEAYNCSSVVVEQPEFSFTERGDDLFQFTVTPLSPRQHDSSLEGTASQPVTGVFQRVFTDVSLPPFHSEVVTVVPPPTTSNPSTSTVTDATTQQPPAVDHVRLAIGLSVAIVIMAVIVVVATIIIYRYRTHKRGIERVEADRRLACDGSVAEIPPYESVSEAQRNYQKSGNDTAKNNGSELTPKELVYTQPIVNKAVGDAPHPPQQDNEVIYKEVTGTKGAHGTIYALPTVAPGSSTAVVDDEKVLYANVKETQVAETEFKAPTNEVAITPLPTYPVTHEAVFEILHAIAANWKAIGQQLKINEDLEDEIDTNNEHDEDCLDEVVKFWLMNCDFQNTWAELADAVERAGEQQLSECIRTEKGVSGYVRFEKSPEHESIQPADGVASMAVTQGIGEGHRDLQQSYSETNPDAKSEVVIPQHYASASCIPGAVVCRQSVLNKRKSLPEPLPEDVIPMFAIGESVQSTDLPEIKAGPFWFSSPEFSVSARNGISAEVLQPFSCSAESTGLHISHEGPIQESEQVSTSALVVSSKSDVMESESDPQTEIAVQHNNWKELTQSSITEGKLVTGIVMVVLVTFPENEERCIICIRIS